MPARKVYVHLSYDRTTRGWRVKQFDETSQLTRVTAVYDGSCILDVLADVLKANGAHKKTLRVAYYTRKRERVNPK